jgi:NlpC/P60 family putative phage cell wall peptidase
MRASLRSPLTMTRSDIVTTALRWVGTPYHHQAAVRGAGCDCLGLVRGVWREVYGVEPEAPPPYSPDWGEAGSVEHIIDAARRHMREIPATEAQARALLQQKWQARDSATLKLPPSFSAVEPGDCLAFDIGEAAALKFRVEKIDRGDFLSCEVVGFDPSSARFGSDSAGADALTKAAPRAFGPPIVEFLDLPLVTGDEPQPWAPRVAAFSSPWAPVAIYRAVNGSANALVATVTASTMMGEIVDGAFYPGPRSIFDNGNSLYVQFYGAAQLLSKSEAEVFDGANAVAVKSPSGDWEIVQFAQAELLAPNKYRLSKLLRAQQGTEAGMADPAPIGARVVVLNAAALATLDIGVDQLGQTLSLRAGPAHDDPGAASYFDYSVTPRGVGLRPYSVSQIAGARLGSGDVVFNWARRTRYGGDAWNPGDVPLNEESERYDLEILDWSSNVLSTVSGLAAPTWTYALADQANDWGGPQGAYPLRVYQLSAQVGRGQAAKTNINL